MTIKEINEQIAIAATEPIDYEELERLMAEKYKIMKEEK